MVKYKVYIKKLVIDMFERKQYMKWLVDARDTEFIKVITGVRRSGKSMLLKMVEKMILDSGVTAEQVVFVNFESSSSDSLKTSENLKEYVQGLGFSKDQKVYFLFDEIQEVSEWQVFVNSLRVDYDADIYLTGSNANLLSGELATYLSGRYITLNVYPLSFAEYLEFSGFDEKVGILDKEFLTYMQWGGFPMLPTLLNEELKRAVLDGIIDSILFKDVALRGEIRDKENLIRVVNFLLDIIGNTISTKKISDTLKGEGITISAPSVDRFLGLLTDAMIFYRAQRYDIRGKSHLRTQAKYYVVDIGLRNQRLGKTYRDNVGSQLENIVYIELKRRGYEVSVGKFDTKEIDFVALKGGVVKYYQVAYQLPFENTREEDNLINLPDNYKKTIITANRMDVGNIAGIDVIHIVDFLLSGR